jgi:glycosyltransferase involved in cell wall biosynthesis
MNTAFTEHFRCPDSVVTIRSTSQQPGNAGFAGVLQATDVNASTNSSDGSLLFRTKLASALRATNISDHELNIPFDLDCLVEDLRCEHYAGHSMEKETSLPPNRIVRNLYYFARPLMSVRFRRVLQRMSLRNKIRTPFPQWPVDRTVDDLFEKLMSMAIRAGGGYPIPFIWFWPDGAEAALTLTHDVEAIGGRDFCEQLMDIDDSFGFKSSFQVVPESRYEVSEAFIQRFHEREFELNVHDINHDGHLFRKHDEFVVRARQINEYAKRFQASGFRSGSLYRNLRWFDAFTFSYDMSVPNVGHLDPQGGGCCTLFPYFVKKVLEIPVTVTQDYSLFHILNTYSIDLWKEQCGLILKGNGLINIIVHPDYIREQQGQNCYRKLLEYLTDFRRENKIWTALPGQIDRWWRQRRELKLTQVGTGWSIEGEGKERAVIAYAHLRDGHLTYSFDRIAAEQHSSAESNAVVPKPSSAPSLNDQGQALRSIESPAIGSGPNPGVSRFLPDSQQRGATTLVGNPATAVCEPQEAAISDRAALPTETFPPRKPLRVCMVSYSFYENDNRVMRYAETLAQRGDYVEVFALRREELPRDEILHGVHVHRIQSRTINEKGRFSYLGRIVQFLFRAAYQVSKNHLAKSYDLLHIHSVPDFLVFAGSLPRLTGTPVILDIHDILPEFYASKFGSEGKSFTFRILQKVEKVSASFSSHVIIANDIWRERLLSRSVAADKCSVVLNCPDRSIFNQNRAVRTSAERFVMLYPGTLNWHQGLDLAVRALARIKNEVPHVDFHIYGDGPARESLEKLVHELGLEGRVFIFKPLPLREIAKAFEHADLGIVPKRKDNFGNEAFSTKILEFMAMGIPVIVADTQIDRYYFDDSVVRFFRGGEDEDLSINMLDLIRNGDERRRLAANATVFVEKIDWTAKRHEYLELVDGLVSK